MIYNQRSWLKKSFHAWLSCSYHLQSHYDFHFIFLGFLFWPFTIHWPPPLKPELSQLKKNSAATTMLHCRYGKLNLVLSDDRFYFQTWCKSAQGWVRLSDGICTTHKISSSISKMCFTGDRSSSSFKCWGQEVMNPWHGGRRLVNSFGNMLSHKMSAINVCRTVDRSLWKLENTS